MDIRKHAACVTNGACRSFLLILLLALGYWLPASDAAAQNRLKIMVLLDSSGSMNGSGINSAYQALQVFFNRTARTNRYEFGLVKGTGGNLVVPMGPGNEQRIMSHVNLNGQTGNPITTLNDYVYGPMPTDCHVVLVVTDGNDGADATGPARELKNRCHKVYVVGVGLQSGARQKLSRVAEAGGGRFCNGADANILTECLVALVEQYVYDKSTGVCATGIGERGYNKADPEKLKNTRDWDCVDFSNVDFTKNTFSTTDRHTINGSLFRNVKLEGRGLSARSAHGADFTNANLKSATLALNEGDNLSFKGADLASTRFTSTHTKPAAEQPCRYGWDFREAKTQNTLFTDVRLCKIRLTGTHAIKLREAHLGGVETPLLTFRRLDMDQNSRLDDITAFEFVVERGEISGTLSNFTVTQATFKTPLKEVEFVAWTVADRVTFAEGVDKSRFDRFNAIRMVIAKSYYHELWFRNSEVSGGEVRTENQITYHLDENTRFSSMLFHGDGDAEMTLNGGSSCLFCTFDRLNTRFEIANGALAGSEIGGSSRGKMEISAVQANLNKVKFQSDVRGSIAQSTLREAVFDYGAEIALNEVDAERCELNGGFTLGAGSDRVSFAQCKLNDFSFGTVDGSFTEIDFTGLEINNITYPFSVKEMDRVIFADVKGDIRFADLESCFGCDFTRATLQDALHGVDMSDSLFNKSTLKNPRGGSTSLFYDGLVSDTRFLDTQIHGKLAGAWDTVTFTGSKLFGIDGAEMIDVDFSGVDFAALSQYSSGIANSEIISSSFRKANFSGVSFALNKSTVEDSSFEYADLTGSKIHDSTLINSSFAGAELLRMGMSIVELDSVKFRTSTVGWAKNIATAAPNWQSVVMTNISFAGAKLHKFGLQISELNDVSFAGADLTDAWMGDSNLQKTEWIPNSGTRMEGVDFSGANLTNAWIRGVISDTNFNGAEVGRAHLIGDYVSVQMSGLRGTGSLQSWPNRLTGADLSRTDLSRFPTSTTQIEDVDLDQAKMGCDRYRFFFPRGNEDARGAYGEPDTGGRAC